MPKRSAAPDAAHEARVLAAYPSRREDLEWDLVEERAALAVPKPYGAIERLVARVLPGPDVVFVTLDDVGTRGWLLADGTRTVRDAAAALRAEFGERAEPAERRALAFYADLARRGYVRLTDGPRPVAGESRGFTPERGYATLPCRRCGREHPIRAPPGARYTCPRCRAVNRVPS